MPRVLASTDSRSSFARKIEVVVSGTREITSTQDNLGLSFGL